MRRPTFGVTSRFALVVLVVIPSLLVMAWKGAAGLTSTRQLTDTLFNDIITTQHASADMVAAMDDVHVTALSSFAARGSDPGRAATLEQLVSDDLIPKADAALAEVQRLHTADDAEELGTIADLASRWIDVRSLWNEMVREPVAPDVASARIDDAYQDLNTIARDLVARETRDGRVEYEESHSPYESKRDVLEIALVASLVASLAAIGWLYRGVLPRARRFAAFADRIADGDFDGHLDAPGGDDLSALGRTLDEMATRRHHERAYDTSQLEFAESMQLTENEPEAHRMLRRHLERSIGGSEVVILNRNNSQDRLEAVTELPAGSPLATTSGRRRAPLVRGRPPGPHARAGRGRGDAPAVPGVLRLPGPRDVHAVPGGRRGHRLGAADRTPPPGGRAGPPGPRLGGAGRARPGEPAQPGHRRDPGGHRLPHGPAEPPGRRTPTCCAWSPRRVGRPSRWPCCSWTSTTSSR